MKCGLSINPPTVWARVVNYVIETKAILLITRNLQFKNNTWLFFRIDEAAV